MTIEPSFDEKLKIEDNKARYKLRGIYTKNGLVVVTFETKFKIHKGSFKLNSLLINPDTGKERFYDEIERVVKKLYDNETNKKKYIESLSNKIDKVFEIDL